MAHHSISFTIRKFFNMRYYNLLIIFCLMVSCRRTPEQILLKTYDLNMYSTPHTTLVFQDNWYPWGGDGYSNIVFHVDSLSQQKIDILKSHGARELPIEEVSFLSDEINEMLQKEKGLAIVTGTASSYSVLFYFEDDGIIFYEVSIL